MLSVKLDNQKTADHTHVLPMMTSERNIPIHLLSLPRVCIKRAGMEIIVINTGRFYERSQPDCTCEHTVGHAMVNPYNSF